MTDSSGASSTSAAQSHSEGNSSTTSTAQQLEHVLQTFYQHILDLTHHVSVAQLDQIEQFFRSFLHVIAGIKEIKTLTFPATQVELKLHDHHVDLTSPVYPPSSQTATPTDDSPPTLTTDPGLRSESSPTEEAATAAAAKSPFSSQKSSSQKPSSPTASSPASSPFPPTRTSNEDFTQVTFDIPVFDAAPLLEFTRALLPHPQAGDAADYLIVCDDIHAYVYGECKRCHHPPDMCHGCTRKKGLRLKLSGFTFAEEPVTVTMWDRTLEGLMHTDLDTLIATYRRAEGLLRKSFLDAYRGRLLYLKGRYSAYRKQVSYNVNYAACKPWTALIPADQSS